jgi:hypothetical protein
MQSPLAVQLVHHIPGRTRLRLSPLPVTPALGEQLANALVATRGIRAVELNRATGGLLCRHDEDLAPERILAVLREVCPELIMLQPGQAPQAAVLPEGPSAVARAMAGAFRSLDGSLREATQGSLDLGTTAAFGFMSAGMLEVAATGKLPLPPWFNLAWWAFRTFITFERTNEPARK